MTFCVVEFSYFGLCNVPCREGLRSSAVYLRDFPRWGKLGARDKVLHTKVVRRACARCAPGKHPPPAPDWHSSGPTIQNTSPEHISNCLWGTRGRRQAKASPTHARPGMRMRQCGGGSLGRQDWAALLMDSSFFFSRILSAKGAGNRFKRGGGCPPPPHHSGPDSTPTACPYPNPGPNRISNRQQPPPKPLHIPCDHSATALEFPRSQQRPARGPDICRPAALSDKARPCHMQRRHHELCIPLGASPCANALNCRTLLPVQTGTCMYGALLDLCVPPGIPETIGKVPEYAAHHRWIILGDFGPPWAGLHYKGRDLGGGPPSGQAGGWRRLPKWLGAVTVGYKCH